MVIIIRFLVLSTVTNLNGWATPLGGTEALSLQGGKPKEFESLEGLPTELNEVLQFDVQDLPNLRVHPSMGTLPSTLPSTPWVHTQSPHPATLPSTFSSTP